MAIGLRSSTDQLRLDNLARKELGQRASTIFPVPCRQAVYEGSEEEQKLANIRVLGKSLAKQSISLIPKIRELDEFLDGHPEYRNRILESHPELVFARLSGSVVWTRKKEYTGFKERVNILDRQLLVEPRMDVYTIGWIDILSINLLSKNMSWKQVKPDIALQVRQLKRN